MPSGIPSRFSPWIQLVNLAGAIYEMLDFYKNAPYKKRGVIPFGMQRGGYLTTEEKIRRQWRTFAADSAKALAKGTDGPLSYADLVTSFQTVRWGSRAGDAHSCMGSHLLRRCRHCASAACMRGSCSLRV